jgi:hypothetical protein
MKRFASGKAGPLAGLAPALAFIQIVWAMPALAQSASASGPSALALAAVVAAHSAVLSSFDRRAMSRLLAGNGGASFPPTRKISVTADSIQCKVSNVDIVSRSCDLTFGAGKRHFTGRDANELYATMAAAGIMGEGAAGTLTESVTKLVCTIDPNAIRQKDGSGADCTFMTGS